MPQDPKKHQPFVPETMEMTELTLRAVLIGLVLTVRARCCQRVLGIASRHHDRRQRIPRQ
jgi:hypothetical protein